MTADSPIALAMADIYSNIPVEILQATFDIVKNTKSLDEMIKEQIVEKKVLMDINVITGLPKRIVLLSRYIEPLADSEVDSYHWTGQSDIYRIPPDARQGRNITAVRRLGPNSTINSRDNGLYGAYMSRSGNSIADYAGINLASRTLDGLSGMPKATYLGDNLIQVTPRIAQLGYSAYCTIEFDSEFLNCPRNMVLPIARLIVIQTKRYIHTRNVVQVDAARIVGGQALGEYKTVIDNYGSENNDQVYNEALLKVRAASFMSVPNFREALKYMM